jgi:hypothetical protein
LKKIASSQFALSPLSLVDFIVLPFDSALSPPPPSTSLYEETRQPVLEQLPLTFEDARTKIEILKKAKSQFLKRMLRDFISYNFLNNLCNFLID